MSRPIRIQYSGAVYHIMSRGNGGHKIFKDSIDYQSFLTVLADVVKRYNIICYAYCLMPNHYHLLIETPDPNLSIAMRQLNGEYTQIYNIRHNRMGHLFQGRFKSILVDMETYRYQIIRYIALNPVRAKMVKNPGLWKYSSHNEMIGKTKKPSGCFDARKALALYDNDQQKARRYYLQNLNLKMDDDSLLKEIENKPVLGSYEFIGRIKKHFKIQAQAKEIPKIERFAHRPQLHKLFERCSTRKKRNDMMLKASIEYGYTLIEISRVVGLHYATISRIINEKYKYKK